MSMPVQEVCCTRCAYQGFIVRRSVTLHYAMPDGRVLKGDREYVWCNDCDSVQQAERLFQDAEVEAELRKLQALGSRLVYELTSALGLRTVANQRRDELLAQREFLRQRQSAPRCLRCAGVALVALSDQPLHSCGGRVQLLPIGEDALRLNYRPEVIELDMEGRRLLRSRVLS